MIEQPIFICNCNPKALVDTFVDALDGLATQSETQMKLKFLEIETGMKSKLNQTFAALNHRRCRKEPVKEFEDECIEKKKSKMCRHSLYKHKSVNLLICRITWKVIAIIPVFG